MHIIPRDWLSRTVYKVLAAATLGAAYALSVNLGAITPGGAA